MNWLPVEVTVGPTAEPLSVADALAHVRAEEGETAYVTALVKAARGHVESYTGLKLMPQTVKLRCDRFEDSMILPVAPIASVATIEYRDSANALQTLDASVYQALLYGLSPQIERVESQTWPSTIRSAAAVTITAQAGYTTVPEEIIHAMKLLVGQWFDVRQPIIDGRFGGAPNAVEALLANFRIYAF